MLCFVLNLHSLSPPLLGDIKQGIVGSQTSQPMKPNFQRLKRKIISKGYHESFLQPELLRKKWPTSVYQQNGTLFGINQPPLLLCQMGMYFPCHLKRPGPELEIGGLEIVVVLLVQMGRQVLYTYIPTGTKCRS